MSKRKRFVISSLALSLGFVGIQFLDNPYRFLAIGIFGLATIAAFIWSLYEGLGRNATLLTLVLPTMFTLGVGIFWFLLPTSVFARLPVVIFYGIGIYVLSLTMNIFTVATIRTIALLRAARGVGFVLTLVTFFLVFDAILSLKAGLGFTALGVGAVSFPLFVQGLWSASLEPKLEKEILTVGLIFSLVVGEIAAGLYFWPVTVVVGSLFYTVSVYMLLGLGQAKIEGRLFAQTVKEYLVVGILVFVGMFIATRWGV
ncbi:hypothetical protein A2V61_00865 [Candidatus Woesebacteria bacterium RBG_19FT_COMBO_47_8]|nr:MAG: hypothetical protein A2V61_00865 [Candidatus Woesebacteria bacterium RBG_19FT_COMBO_47_8]HJX59516.1 hypothetical protein [Patescibacteria group bacterium]